MVLNDNDYLYSHSSFSPMGKCFGKNIQATSGRGELVEIRLSDQLGQELLTRFHNRDESVSDDMFEEYFGYPLVAESGSKNLLGFSVGEYFVCPLTLYYHVDDELRSPQSMVISPHLYLDLIILITNCPVPCYWIRKSEGEIPSASGG